MQHSKLFHFDLYASQDYPPYSMKSYLRLLLSFIFCFSLLAGETLCCEMNDSEQRITEITSVQQFTQIKDINLSNAHSSHSDQNSHSETHQCVGCAHAPFVPINSSFYSLTSLDTLLYLSNTNFLFEDPFLDGPFQPPKS